LLNQETKGSKITLFILFEEDINIKRLYVSHIKFENFMYIIGSSDGKIGTSTDGVNWSIQNITGTWRAIAYGNGQWAVVNNIGSLNNTNAKLLTSTDAVNWTTHDLLHNSIKIIYANGYWFRVGAGYHYSTDLVNWTSYETYNDWRNVHYANGRWVIVGNYDTNLSAMPNKIGTSTDLVNWTFTPTDKKWFDVTYGNEKWLISSPNGYIGTSTDGENWSIQELAGVWNSTIYFKSSFFKTKTILDLNSGSHKFVVCTYDGIIASSNDGIIWYSETFDTIWRSSYYVPNISMHIVVGIDKIAYNSEISANSSWNIIPLTGGWRHIALKNNVIVIASDEGKIAYSTNGINWTVLDYES
jgi:hypothetical protein